MFLKSFSGLQARASQLLLFILVAAAAAAAAAATAKSLESCPTLCDPMDGSPPGSPGPWESPGKNTGVSCCFFLQGIFLTQGVNLHLLCLLHCRQILCLWAIRKIPVINIITHIQIYINTNIYEDR